MSEAFELFDEALGVAFGVAVGELVGAEVAVGLAGGENGALLTGGEALRARLEHLIVPAAQQGLGDVVLAAQLRDRALATGARVVSGLTALMRPVSAPGAARS